MLQSIILIDPQASLSARPGPNTLVVDRLEDEKVITIKQIRDMIIWLGQHGFESGPKQAIVLQAQRWHPAAPEALLKTLEEPVVDTTIILTTHHPATLPETIRSRCATLLLTSVSPEQLTAWGLVVDQPEPFQAPIDWQQFSQWPAAERWLAVEAWFKAKMDIAAIIQNWEQQLIATLAVGSLDEPAENLVAQLAAVSQTRISLRANVLPRLAVNNLLLSLEQ
jgi:hypothetical protein